MTDQPASIVSADYAALLSDIKQRVRHGQTRAVLAVNAELIRLYWDIGALIHARQQQEGWGAGVIPRLARDLHNELPDEKGFSERNSIQKGHRLWPFFDLTQAGSESLESSLPTIEEIERELEGGA